MCSKSLVDSVESCTSQTYFPRTGGGYMTPVPLMQKDCTHQSTWFDTCDQCLGSFRYILGTFDRLSVSWLLVFAPLRINQVLLPRAWTRLREPRWHLIGVWPGGSLCLRHVLGAVSELPCEQPGQAVHRQIFQGQCQHRQIGSYHSTHEHLHYGHLRPGWTNPGVHSHWSPCETNGIGDGIGDDHRIRRYQRLQDSIRLQNGMWYSSGCWLSRTKPCMVIIDNFKVDPTQSTWYKLGHVFPFQLASHGRPRTPSKTGCCAWWAQANHTASMLLWATM